MAISVRLSPEIEKRLENLSKVTGRSKSFYIKELIEDNIDDLEDIYLAMSTLEKVRSAKEITHSAASVRQELGLSD